MIKIEKWDERKDELNEKVIKKKRKKRLYTNISRKWKQNETNLI